MPKPVPKPSFDRRVPTRSRRNNFSKKVRDEISERDEGICQQCGSIGTQIHHVKYRSQGGRGVFTNGLTVCNSCHSKIHADKELSDYWVNRFIDRYGENFYKDSWDE